MKRKTTFIKAFFFRNIRGFFLFLVLVLVLAVALYTWQAYKSNFSKKGLYKIEEAELTLGKWRIANTSQRAVLEKALEEQMLALKGLELGFQTQARLFFLQACYAFWVKKDWDEALSKFACVSSSYYQYAPSLLYRASIYEERGDLDQAYCMYMSLGNLGEPFFKSQGLFYQALILEKKGDLDSAKSLYEAILDEYPQFVWAQLSKNRLVLWSISS